MELGLAFVVYAPDIGLACHGQDGDKHFVFGQELGNLLRAGGFGLDQLEVFGVALLDSGFVTLT